MDLDFIARLLGLVERSTVGEVDLTIDGARLRIVKAAHGAPAQAAPQGAEPTKPAKAPVPQPSAPGAGKKLHLVKAGFPGTFYRAPAPDAAPFVAVGDKVEDGQQLAIMEAMKTMNPVEADIAGTVVRITAEDAQPVEAGDLLFEIEPHA